MATENSVLYVYNMDTNEGGDLTLLRTHNLDGRPDDGKTAVDGSPKGAEAAGSSGAAAAESGIVNYAFCKLFDFVTQTF